MASIIDSIKSVYSDKFALLKLCAFSYIIHLIFKLIMTNDDTNLYNILIISLIMLLYLGFSSIIINNRINQRMNTLPTLNINVFLEVAFKSFGISVPYLFISFVIVNIVVGMFSFEGIPQQIAICLIRFCVFCGFATSLINFSEKYEIKDGFDIVKIIEGVADVLVYTITGLISMIILAIIIAAPFLYLIYTFFQIGLLFEYTAVLIITTNVAILADYWGQLHYDISSRDKYY